MGGGGSKETTCCGGGTSGPVAPSNAEPVRVTITGAAGQIGYSLLPMIANGNMFGKSQRVILQCLDLNLPGVKENMRGIQMELQDGNFPLLHKAEFVTDDEKAFANADYAILLGAFPRQEGREKRDLMDKNVMIFRTMGHALDKFAKNSCKVLVVGNPANTNALICSHYAKSLDKSNFFALTRLDHNRALGAIAGRANVAVGQVRNVVVLGNHTKTQVPYAQACTIRGKRIVDAFKGEDLEWLNNRFPEEIQKRGAAIISARKGSSALSAARAITDHIHDLHVGVQGPHFVSMGVLTDGKSYGVEEGLIFGMPVNCPGQGNYTINQSLVLDPETIEKVKISEKDLIEERTMAMEIIKKHEDDRASARGSALRQREAPPAKTT